MDTVYFDYYPDIENVYIVYTREFMTQNKPVYKIGQTCRESHKRFRGYSKSTKEIITMNVKDSKKIESIIIDRFKNLFFQRLDIGTEYFEGDIYKMIDEFISIVREDYKTPEGNISAPCISTVPTKLDPNLNVTALTIELIREFIPKYTFEMVKNTKEGLKQWILLLITCKGGTNFKCIDRDTPVFSRLNEKGRWVKDGVKFIKNIFIEKSSDGTTLLDRICSYYIAVVNAKKSISDMNQMEHWRERLECIETFMNTIKTPNVKRSKFLREILEDIAYERYPKEYIPIFPE